ncbi:LmbE family N-acetylglucosaminyl deacetylase [Paenibacillus taihuensis]|uniref:LmbE family N-acetylglucosaminyl deacetylase n=1 Tax=Paenibacillus taihuensis TaxID=1156355 RepID=A0A3D9SKV8_9BACL|nr:PIG-L family deacetylase [Paenibacillus taihuensis]REE91550.1 LmbE family N-acetylglucosaminyl deacetylase [Paenibacillus taihuensis]
MGIFLYSGQRALVLAPHADDETLGCAGVIQKYISQGSSVRTVIASITLNDSNRYSKEQSGYGIYSGTKRLSEFKEAMRLLGVADYHILYPDKSGEQLYDSKLDLLPRAELVAHIERHIEEFRPTVMYIPSITKHQDHEALHQAAIAAVRPYFWNGAVLVYETDGELTFQPSLYISLTKEEMNLKMRALEAYKTQLGSMIHPVHPESLFHKAKFRGNQTYVEFAEAFEIIRMHG